MCVYLLLAWFASLSGANLLSIFNLTQTDVESDTSSWLRPSPYPMLPYRLPPIRHTNIWRNPLIRSVEYTIIMVLHNVGDIIMPYIDALMKNAGPETWEFIIVFDDCDDSTVGVIETQLINNPWVRSASLQHLRTILQYTSVQETAAENIAMRAAVGKFIVLVQSDMMIQHPSFNQHLCLPHTLFHDVHWVSGRCAYNEGLHAVVGRCGTDVFEPLKISTWNAFYVRNYANRGPVCLNATRVRILNYFDEVHFRVDDADHELNARAFMQYGWVSGFLPINWTCNKLHRATYREQFRNLTSSSPKHIYMKLYKTAFNVRANNDSHLATWQNKYRIASLYHMPEFRLLN